MLHAAAPRSARKVIKKHVAVEGTIFHPTGCGRHDLVQHRGNLFHVIVGGFGVHDHSIVSAAFVEIGFLEHSDLDRRIHQPVVVRRAEPTSGYCSQRRGHVPALGNLAKAHDHRPVPRVHRIHQNLSQIKKCMMRIELRSEGPGRIHKDLILNHGAALRVRDLPPALVHRAHGDRVAGAVFRPHPVHVLREVAHLIQRVPYRKLQLPLRRSLRQQNLHLDQMPLRIGQRNCVSSRLRRLPERHQGCNGDRKDTTDCHPERSDCFANAKRSRSRRISYPLAASPSPIRHSLYDPLSWWTNLSRNKRSRKLCHLPAFAELALPASPANTRNRAGSFS